MDRRYPSWFLETLKVWSQYLAIVLAAIPAAVLASILIARGFSEQTAMIVCVPVALSMAFVGWQLVVWSRKQRQLVVSASRNTAYQMNLIYQLGPPVVTAAGFIESLSRAAIHTFEHAPALNEAPARLPAESVYIGNNMGMFRLPRASQQQRRVVMLVGFKAQQGT